MDLLEIIYYAGYLLKKSNSLKHQKRLPYKVISVGNITVGGTGKTPAVIALAKEAQKRGFRPVILTRGYRGKAKGPFFVNKTIENSMPLHEMAGDEPLLMAENLKDVPIVKCADRYKGGIFAISNQQSAISNQPLLFILDDGFQHWRLYRDTDILLIDSVNPFGNRKLLPAGILREPLKEVERADVIVLTKTSQSAGDSSLAKEISKYSKDAPVFIAEHKLVCLRTLSGKDLPCDTISGNNIIGFCGIGSPESFKNSLLSLKANLKEFMIFRDHYSYVPENIALIKEMALKNKADWIVTTEKDIIRLKGFDLPENLISLVIKFDINENFYDKIFLEA